MRASIFLLLFAASLFAAVTAHADDTDLIWGPGGYVASLDRLQAKGNASERSQAAREERWLNANQAHVKALMKWLRLNNRLNPG
jgi:hypothetical protein